MENKNILSTGQRSEVQKNKEKSINRRSFLKRAAYSAPVLITMGQLVKPANAEADRVGSVASKPVW